MFRVWLEYFGKVFGRITVAVPAMEQVKNALAAEPLLRKVYQREPTLVGVDAY
jgi:hypothetical protein